MRENLKRCKYCLKLRTISAKITPQKGVIKIHGEIMIKLHNTPHRSRGYALTKTFTVWRKNGCKLFHLFSIRWFLFMYCFAILFWSSTFLFLFPFLFLCSLFCVLLLRFLFYRFCFLFDITVPFFRTTVIFAKLYSKKKGFWPSKLVTNTVAGRFNKSISHIVWNTDFAQGKWS